MLNAKDSLSCLHCSYSFPLKKKKINYCCGPTHVSSLGLADTVHSANGLQLMCWIENGLYKQHVGSLDDIQAI